MKRTISIILTLILSSYGVMGQDFALPRPPAELRTPSLRACWLVEHYWDNAILKNLDGENFEQAFVNYVALFPICADDTLCRSSVAKLMKKADDDGVAAGFCHLAGKYLFDLESPMANEEYFSFFVPWAQDRPHLELIIGNNRLGHHVEDFSFETINGDLCDFSEVPGKRLLLLYETGCPDCKGMIRYLRSGAFLRTCPELSDATIVAIAVNASRESYRESASELPDSWVTGYDSTGTINGTAFAIRKLPDVYFISDTGIVLGKHVTFKM